MGSSEDKLQPKIIGRQNPARLWARGSDLDLARARLGLDLGLWIRSVLFGLGSARGSARGWLRSELDLGLNFSRICLTQAG